MLRGIRVRRKERKCRKDIRNWGKEDIPRRGIKRG